MPSIVFGYVGLFVLPGFCTAHDNQPTIKKLPAKALRRVLAASLHEGVL